MIALIYGLIITFSIGFIVSNIVFGCRKFFLCHTAIKSAFAFGLGFGITSFISFIGLLFINQLSSICIVMIDSIVIIVSIYLYIRTRKTTTNTLCDHLRTQKITSSAKLMDRGLLVALILCTYSAVLCFTLWSKNLPYGAWDAWSIWNANAKFIFLGGSHWKQALTSVLLGSSTDYPWMYPMTISRLWFYANSDTVLAPIIVSSLYAASTVLLLGSSLSLIKSATNARIACIVLLTTPFFILHTTSQQADIPLGYYFLGTLVLWQLWILTNKQIVLFLTGFFAGLSMFMKNEGIFFIIMLSIVYGMFTTIQKTRHKWKSYSLFFLGTVPFIILNLIMRVIAPLPQSIGGKTPWLIYFSRLLDSNRHEIALSAFFYIGKTFTQIPPVIWLMFCFYALLVGISMTRQTFVRVMTILWQIILMLCGYYAIYIIISPDIVWHIKSSLDRLYLQLWPSFLLFYFLLIGPEDIPLENAKEDKNQNHQHQKIGKTSKKQEKSK